MMLAVAFSFDLFATQSSASNRDALSNELIHEAALAQQWHKKPAIFSGGGNQTYVGYQLSKTDNMDGKFSIRTQDATHLEIEAEGTELGKDGINKVKLVIRVVPDSSVSYVNELN